MKNVICLLVLFLCFYSVSFSQTPTYNKITGNTEFLNQGKLRLSGYKRLTGDSVLTTDANGNLMFTVGGGGTGGLDTIYTVHPIRVIDSTDGKRYLVVAQTWLDSVYSLIVGGYGTPTGINLVRLNSEEIAINLPNLHTDSAAIHTVTDVDDTTKDFNRPDGVTYRVKIIGAQGTYFGPTYHGLSSIGVGVGYGLVVQGDTTIYVDTSVIHGGGGGGTLQDAFDASQTAGDNPQINVGAVALNIGGTGDVLHSTATGTSVTAIAGTVVGSGNGVTGTTDDGVGVSGSALVGQAGFFNATSDASTPIYGNLSGASTNTVSPMIQLRRQTSGSPADGIGASIEFQIDGGTQVSNTFGSRWKSVSGLLPELFFTGQESFVQAEWMKLDGTYGYLKTDTIATRAYARSAGGGGSETLDQVIANGNQLTTDRTIDLNTHIFQANYNNTGLTISPILGSESSTLLAYNSTGSSNQAKYYAATTNSDAAALIEANFNDGEKRSRIDAFANTSEATIEYTADTHAFIGAIKNNADSSTAPFNVLTLDENNVLKRAALPTGGNGIYGGSGSLVGSTTVDLAGNEFTISDVTGTFIDFDPNGGIYLGSENGGTFPNSAIQISNDFGLEFTGPAKLNSYASGAITGTPAYGLAIEADGKVVATSLSSAVPLSYINEIYTMGNSITSNGGYQARLTTLLNDTGWSIVNYGISGDFTYEMVTRNTDMLKASPTYAIYMGGINDIVNSSTALDIEANLQTMYTAAHAAGSTVVGITILPFKGNVNWTSGKQAKVDSVNTWILNTATDIDYRLDAYTALENPSWPDALLPAYTGADSLHLSSAGQIALGNYIYANATFTKRTAFKKLSYTGNYTISQDLTPIASPAFVGLNTQNLRVVTDRYPSIPAPAMSSYRRGLTTQVRGGMIYDTTLNLLTISNGTTWDTINHQSLQSVATIGNSYTGQIQGGSLYSTGQTIIGSAGLAQTTSSLPVYKTLTGAVSAYGVNSGGQVQSDVTTAATNFVSVMNTQAASFTLNAFFDYQTTAGTIGSGSHINNKYGYYAGSSTAADNIYAFRADQTVGSTYYNFYAGGSAMNFLTGGLTIGSLSVNRSGLLNVNQNTTGIGTISTSASGTTVTGVNTTFLTTFSIGQTITANSETRTISAIGSNTSMTTDAWTNTNSSIAYTLTGGAVMAVNGNGKVGIGTSSPNVSALLDLTSTTNGLLPPRMTTTQINAIATPAEGLLAFDLTLHKGKFYDGTVWGTSARTDVAQTFTGTQTFGALVATTLNGNTFTTGTYTLTGTAAKTLTFTNSLTLTGTDGTTMTFPTTSASIARTDAANTFTGTQTAAASAVGTTNVYAVRGTNITAAALGAVQYSPSNALQGNTWNTTTGTSRAVEWKWYVKPIQTTSDYAQLLFGFNSNGGATTDYVIFDPVTGVQSTLGFVVPSKFWISGGTNNGDVLIRNGSAAAFGKFQLGGTTSSFPAISANGTDIAILDAAAGTASKLGIAETAINSTLQIGGSYADSLVASAVDITAGARNKTILITATGKTATLPTAVGILGRVYTIVYTAASGTATIATTSSQTFTNITSTPTTLTLSAAAAGTITSYTLQSDGANWVVINKVKNE